MWQGKSKKVGAQLLRDSGVMGWGRRSGGAGVGGSALRESSTGKVPGLGELLCEDGRGEKGIESAE